MPRELPSLKLSDGGILEIRRFGRRHTIMRSYPEPHTAPDLYRDLLLNDAIVKFAELLREDVMEGLDG